MALKDTFLSSTNPEMDLEGQHIYGMKNEILDMLEQDMSLEDAILFHQNTYGFPQSNDFFNMHDGFHIILAMALYAHNGRAGPTEYQGSQASEALLILMQSCIHDMALSPSTLTKSGLKNKAKADYKKIIKQIEAKENAVRTLLWILEKETGSNPLDILKRNDFTIEDLCAEANRHDGIHAELTSSQTDKTASILYKGKRYGPGKLGGSSWPSGSNGFREFVPYTPDIHHDIDIMVEIMYDLTLNIRNAFQDHIETTKCSKSIEEYAKFLAGFMKEKTTRDIYKDVAGHDYHAASAPQNNDTVDMPALSKAA